MANTFRRLLPSIVAVGVLATLIAPASATLVLPTAAPPPRTATAAVGTALQLPTALGSPLSVPPPAVPRSADWATFRHDLARTASNPNESTLASSNLSSLQQVWVVHTAGAVEGSATFVAGILYFGDWAGYEYAVNASDGIVLWKTFLGTTSGGCPYGPKVGVTSSPTLRDGILYVGGGDSYWYALNQTTGAIVGKLWIGTNEPSGGNYNWASPLLVGARAYIGVASMCGSPLVQGKLLLVDLSDPANLSNASILRTFDAVPNGTTGASIAGSPSYDPRTNTVYVATGTNGTATGPYARAIVALNGSTLAVRGSWQLGSSAGGDSNYSSGPMLFNATNGSRLVVAENQDGVDYALNASNVSAGPIWSQPIADPGCGFAPAAFDGNETYLAGGCVTVGGKLRGGAIRAVSPSNVTRWTDYETGASMGGASVANGIVYTVSEAVAVLPTEWTYTSTLLALNATTGTKAFAATLPSVAVNSTLTIADGRVFVPFANENLSHGGGIYAYGLPLTVTATTSSSSTTNTTEVRFVAAPGGGYPGYAVRWSFGDGTNGTGLVAWHTYPHSGKWTYGATCTDAAGATAAWSGEVAVITPSLPNVTVSAMPTSGVAPLYVSASATVTGGKAPYHYRWYYGDGTSANGTNSTTHEYLTSGSFPLSVQISDASGYESTATTSITVASTLGVVLRASPTVGTAPLAVTFTALPSGGVAPYSLNWSFGDESPVVAGTQDVVSYTYRTVGTYQATVTLSDSVPADGSTAANVTIDVVPPPLNVSISATVTSGPGCTSSASTVEFHALTLGGSGRGLSYNWTFGDGTSSTGTQFVNHTYGGGSRYFVTVVTRDSAGDTNESSTEVSWSIPACAPPTPGATNSSGTAGGTLYPWEIFYGLVVAAAIVGVAGVLVIRRRRRPPEGDGTAPDDPGPLGDGPPD